MSGDGQPLVYSRTNASIDIIKPFLDLFEKSGKAVGANDDGRVPLMMDVPLAA
jgi:hypothetical protein